MTTVIALLRGVNVGGHGKLPMATLRSLAESLGLGEVRTYLQSGNLVFRTARRDLRRIASSLEEAIGRECGFRPAVILRTAAELRRAVELNPFPGRDPARLAVLFAEAAPSAEAIARALEIRAEPDLLVHAGSELYAYYPNGFARTKLTVPALERVLKVRLTGRNWNTVTNLLAMTEGR